MTKSKKRYMSMTDVKRLVSRWFDERVEIKNGATLKTTDGRDDFLKWLKGQRDRGDIAGYQWGRAMEQKRFRLEHVGRDWLFHGIKLKPPAEGRLVKTVEPRALVERWLEESVEIDSEAKTRKNEAFRNFLEWVETQGELSSSPTPLQFDLGIRDNGFEQDRDINGWFIIRGIKLKDD